MPRDGTLLTVAIAAAFVSGMLAIHGHSDRVENGYRLAAARREGEVLLREAIQAERRASVLRLPPAVAARAQNVHKLGLEYPRDRRVLSQDEVARLMAPAAPAAAPVFAPAGASRPAEVMAR
jgi:hypothetical protein